MHSKRTRRVLVGLILRSYAGLISDTGRMIEAFLDPLMFFVVWGMLYSSGVVESEVSHSLLVVNLIWAATAGVQKQASLTFMYDLWSKEFVELLRAGVTSTQYLAAMLGFGCAAGLLIVAFYCALAPLLFGADRETVALMIWLLPAYVLTGLSITCFGAGIVLRFSQLYGFVSTTMTQVSVLMASPFVPRSSLPTWWQAMNSCIPFTWIFEAARIGDSHAMAIGTTLSVGWFLVGLLFYFAMFASARRAGCLSRI